MYEAAVDLLRLQVEGSAIRGDPLRLPVDKLIIQLSEIIDEISFEKSKVKDTEQLKRLEILSSGVLYAALAMRFTTEVGLIALPAIDREKGNDHIPGWDVNVWGKNEDGIVDLSTRRKLRISRNVDVPMRQGDIGIIPFDVIKKTSPVSVIAKNFISSAREDERSRRAAKLIARWSTNLQPVFDGALQLIV